MALTKDLPNFKLSEFRHPELIEPLAANFLQAVRERYAAPIRVTSDARTAVENAAVGGSPLSWHVKGRAFDLRWPADDQLAYRLLRALVLQTEEWTEDMTLELELVYSERDKHIHFAVKDNGSPSRLIVAAD